MSDGNVMAQAVRAVLGRLDEHVEGIEPESALPCPDALEALASVFGLSPFEREVLLLCAAMELDATTAGRCAAASGSTRVYPTFSLALAALTDPHWSALTPISPLRRWRLVELDEEAGLAIGRLRIDERILHFLLGAP